MGKYKWMLLIYKIPPAPARHRIAIWRKLKKLGVLYLQKSVCVLPDSPYLHDELENAAHDIENFGGEATLIFTDRIEKEEKMTAEFQKWADGEYEKIIGKCGKFLSSISKTTKHAKVKELSGLLEEMKRSFTEVQCRDFFSVTKGKEAEEKLRECEKRYLRIFKSG